MCKHGQSNCRGRVGCMWCGVTRVLWTSAGILGLAFGFLATTAALPTAALAAQHGTIFTKGACGPPAAQGPVKVGEVYTCQFSEGNFNLGATGDTAGDDQTITSLIDIIDKNGDNIYGPPPDFTSGNLLPLLTIAGYSGGAQCYSDTLGGTPVTVGNSGSVICLLPGGASIGQGSSVSFVRYGLYTVVAGDATPLKDQSTLVWQDLCTSGDGDCPVGNQTTSSGSQAAIVTAKISIAPDATNRVGASHTFTVTLQKDLGLGGGFVAAAGEHVDVTLTDSNGATHSAPTGTCTNAGANTDANGQCTITFTSPTTGQVTGHASSTLSVSGSVSFTVETNGVAPNSADAVKTFVDAKIAIAPDATNEVGHSHTFTVTLDKDLGNGGGFVPAAGEHVDVTLTDSDGAVHSAPTGTCTNAGANTDANGQCTITFTSPTAGKVTGHATSTLSVNTVSITVQTNGVSPNSGDAVKTFVDANIQINPPTATNPVNTNHTLTGHVNINAGDGLGFVNAPADTLITFSLQNSNGATAVFVGGVNTCTTAGGTGSCTVQITSPTTGTTSIHAATDVTVGGVPLHRETDGTGLNSVDAQKTWASVKISIAPDATNEVGASHTFTVTLQKDLGAGFVAAAGEHVDVTLTDSNGATHTAPTGTCTNGGVNTDVNGQCTITFTSNAAGKVTGHATSTLTVGSGQITVETDGTGGNSVDAVKTFVDANIQITPATATNPVDTNHTLTGHVNINAGDGLGFVNAPADTLITFSLQNSNGATAVFVGGVNTCTTVGSTGSCTVQINSPTTGTTTIHAVTDVTVLGVVLHRETDGTGSNSVDAQKTWGSVKISIAPDATNEVGASHTFTVTLQKDTGSGFVPAAGEHVDVTLTDSNGAAHTAPTGTCTNAGPNTDVNGQCTITFSSPTAGKVTGHASSTLTVGSGQITVATDGTGGSSGDAVKTFVDANIQITPAEATNPVNTNHTLTGHVNINAGDGLGFVNAPADTLITFSITGGPGSFVGASTCTTVGSTGSCTVQISSPTAGTTTIHAATDVTVGGVSLHRETDGTGLNSVDAIKHWVAPATKLTLVSQDPPNPVDPGTLVTIIVQETNTGTDTLSNVNVTGTGCTPYDPANVATLLPGDSANFTCMFSPGVDTHWTATGHGLDSQDQEVGSNCPSETECEVVEGDVTIKTTTVGCRMTGGKNNWVGDIDAQFGSDGSAGPFYTVGGQVGAPGANGCIDVPPKGQCKGDNNTCVGGPHDGEACDPDGSCPNYDKTNAPWGEWEHVHHAGQDDDNSFIEPGSFAFHAGSHSAPDAAFIQQVTCTDPGWCVQARPAPAKQIYWEGLGVFQNLNGPKHTDIPLPIFADNCPVVPYNQNKKKGDPTLHYYTAHVGDFGEPAGAFQKPVAGCSEPGGFGGDPWMFSLGNDSATCDQLTGDNVLDDVVTDVAKTAAHPLCTAQACSESDGNTGCPDWYDIEIHCTADPASPVIYHVGHFIDEGNFQLHPPVGESCNPDDTTPS
jgi:hypothetical protein